MEGKKDKKINENAGKTMIDTFRLMFKNMKSGNVIYLAFSKKSFHILIFTIAIGTAANVALIDILLQGTGFVTRANTMIVTFQLILSGLSVISGIWLFLKGVTVITDN